MVTPMSLDSNKRGTYKNRTATRETEMPVFLKDFIALLSIVGFTGGLFMWMDMASRLA
jgi:hypothetical protein